MLTILPLGIPHFQNDHFSIPSISLRVPTKEDRGIIHERSLKPILKNPFFPCKNHLIPTQIAKITACRCSLQNPDVESPETFLVGRSMDPQTLPCLLKSCSTLKEVKCVHAATLRLLDNCMVFVGNNLISSYVSFSNLAISRKLFDGMPERNVVSWTAILNGYLKMGLYDEALRLFKKLIESQIQANSMTFVCLLKVCGRRFDLEVGRQVHASIIKGNWSNLIVDSALVYFYAQCGDLIGASIVFDRMPERDVISWTTMITAYTQHGQEDEAFSMFSSMQHHGFHPNEFTMCSALKACGKQKAVRFGRQLHGAIIKRVVKDDVFVGSSLVSMYAKCGEVSDARLAFNLMPRRNSVAWTSLISGCAQNGLGEEALSLFRRMKRSRIFINSQTIVSVLSACGSVRSLCLGKEVHGLVLKSFIDGNIHIGTTLIWLYCKCGEYAYAARVLEALPARGVLPWTSIISGYASLGYDSEALGFLSDMLLEGVEPNPYTYSSALKACAKLEAVKYGQWIHGSANKSRALSNVFVGSALINMYMKCGCVVDASRVFRTMPDPNLVSWKTMIIGYAKNGYCSEALKLLYQMAAEGFNVDDFILSTVVSSCGDFQWESEFPSASCSQLG